MQILRTGQCEADKCPVVSQQQEGLRALAPRCLSTYTGPLGLPPHTVGLVSERHRERTREIRFSDWVSSLWKMLISLQVILSQGFSKHSFAFLPLLPVLIKSYPASGPCRMLSGASWMARLGKYTTKRQWQEFKLRSFSRFTLLETAIHDVHLSSQHPTSTSFPLSQVRSLVCCLPCLRL